MTRRYGRGMWRFAPRCRQRYLGMKSPPDHRAAILSMSQVPGPSSGIIVSRQSNPAPGSRELVWPLPIGRKSNLITILTTGPWSRLPCTESCKRELVSQGKNRWLCRHVKRNPERLITENAGTLLEILASAQTMHAKTVDVLMMGAVFPFASTLETDWQRRGLRASDQSFEVR
jgi:hypothetical protein